MGSLVRASLVNLGTRVLAVVLGLALMLITARLGTEAQGAFALFLAVEAVLLAAGSGFGVAIARELSHRQAHPGALVGSAVVVCAGIGVATAAALAAVAAHAGPAYGSLAWLAVAAPLMWMSGNLSGIWLGRGRMGALAFWMLAPVALTLAGIGLAWLARPPLMLAAVLAAWVASRLIVALLSLGAAWRGGWWGRARLDALRPQARFVAIIGLTNVVSLLNYKADIFLVEHFLGLAPTGIYSVAVSVAELLWLVSSAVTTAAYARIGTPDRAAAARLTVQAMQASVALLALISPLLWAVAAWAIPRWLGEAYRPAVPVLALLLPGVVLFGAASALSAWFTNQAGRPQVPALLAAGSLLINLAVSWWAIPRWGLMGGALATTLSYGLTMAAAGVWFGRAAGVPLRQLLVPDRQTLASWSAGWGSRGWPGHRGRGQ